MVQFAHMWSIFAQSAMFAGLPLLIVAFFIFAYPTQVSAETIIATSSLSTTINSDDGLHVYEATVSSIRINGVSGNVYQKAFKSGDEKLYLNTHTHSEFGVPTTTVDFSSLDMDDVPVSSFGKRAGHRRVNGKDKFPSFHAYYGPFSIPKDAIDGQYPIFVTATDLASTTATTSVTITIDNTPPELLLTDISFSEIPFTESSTISVTGTAKDTATPVHVERVYMTLRDDAGVIMPIRSGKKVYDTISFSSFAFADVKTASTSEVFTDTVLEIIPSVWAMIPEATTLDVYIGGYDFAGNFATSTTLSVPIPKDPCLVQGACVSNVLFLPGIQGSRLYEGVSCGLEEEQKLWEPSRLFDDEKLERLALNEDGGSVCEDIYTKDGDVLDKVGGADFYTPLIDALDALATDGVMNDWKATAYDWRLSLHDLIARGTLLDGRISYTSATNTPYIEQTLRMLAKSSKTGKVSIVAHSNGGLLAKALMRTLGTEAPVLIDQVIMVGVPQTGAPKGAGALLVGEDAGTYKFGLPVISNKASRAFAQNSPMAYHLLPSKDYFKSISSDPTHPVIHFSGQGYETERTVYGNSIESWDTFKDFARATNGEREKPNKEDLLTSEILNTQLLEYAERIHDEIDVWIPPEEIEVHQIAGWGLDTVAGIDFYFEERPTLSTKNPKTHRGIRRYRPIFTEDGDGTVPVPSALHMSTSTPNVKKYWLDLFGYSRDTRSSHDHGDIFAVEPIGQLITNLLQSKDVPVPQYINTSAPRPRVDEKKLIYTLHSPLTLQLTDTKGNTSGLSTDGTISENIPGSTFGIFGEVQYLIAPEGQYTLLLQGIREGVFSLDIQETISGVVTASTTIANAPVTASTTVRMSISGGVDTASVLSIDKDGDGEAEILIQPKAGNIVVYTEPEEVKKVEPVVTAPPGRAAGGPGYNPYKIVQTGQVSKPEPLIIATTTVLATTTVIVPELASATSTPSAEAQATSTPEESFDAPTPPPALALEQNEQSIESVVINQTSTDVVDVPETNEPSVPQTASVFDAVSQQGIFSKISAVVYNGFHKLWTAFLSFF